MEGQPTDRFDRDLTVVVRTIVGEEKPSAFVLTKGIGMIATAAAMSVATTSFALAAVLVVVAGLAAWLSSRAPPPETTKVTRTTRVRVSSRALSFDGKDIPLSRIESAVFQPRSGDTPPAVRVLDDRAKVVFESHVADDTEGADLLSALGHDPRLHRSRFLVSSPFGTTMLRRLLTLLAGYGALAAALMTPLVHGGIVIPLVLALFLAPRLLIGSTAVVEVGDDGLLVRWFGTKRFVPYEAIAGVKQVGMFVHVHLPDGRPLVFNPNFNADGRDGAALLARIEAARSARITATLPAGDIALELARSARPVSAWRSDLERLVGRDHYRERRLPTEALWNVVFDPSATEDARAAAAVALRAGGDAAPRLRIAAEAVASPRLRIALEAAADPATTDEALEATLEELGAPHEHARTRPG